MSPDEKAQAVRQFEGFVRPLVPRPHELFSRTEPSHSYNCHGLAFANRRAFVEEDSVLDVLPDDGYTRIELREVLPGDVAIYWYEDDPLRPEHTGVVTWVEPGSALRVPWVLSKWGDGSEYVHRFNNTPYKGRCEFFREGQE